MIRLLLVALIGSASGSLFLTTLFVASLFKGSIVHTILMTPLVLPFGIVIGVLPALIVTAAMSRAIRQNDNRVRHIALWLGFGGLVAAAPFAFAITADGYNSDKLAGLAMIAMAGMFGTFVVAKLLGRP